MHAIAMCLSAETRTVDRVSGLEVVANLSSNVVVVVIVVCYAGLAKHEAMIASSARNRC